MTQQARQTAINLGYVGVANLIFIYFIIKIIKVQLDKIVNKLEKISTMIGKTLLSEEETVEIFDLILYQHIDLKLDFFKEILIRNSIHEREEQIKKNIRSKVEEITQKEAAKLSKYNTPAGDLGDILLSINYDKFCKEIYEIFFTDDKIDNKLIDLKRLMCSYVNDLVTKIKREIKSRNF